MSYKNFISCNDQALTRLVLHVPNVGAWFADLEFAEAPTMAAPPWTIKLGDLVLVGTPQPDANGAFGERRRARVVAGAGGWGTSIPSRSYHNDIGVKAETVVRDAATAVGEHLGTVTPGVERLGIDFVREAGPAARALEAAVGVTPWWVSYDGATHIGERAEVEAPAEVQILDFDPLTNRATLTCDNPSAVTIGTRLIDRTDSPRIVRELEFIAKADSFRVSAHCGNDARTRSHIAEALIAIARKASNEKLFGVYEYRVINMQVDRVKLQAVRADDGVPDAAPISLCFGVPSAQATLTRGSIVYVFFVGGRRTEPRIMGYGGKGSPGYVAERLDLGGDSAQDAARKGDTVEVILPPMIHVGTFNGLIGGVPSSGVVTGTVSATLPKAIGTVITGSSKVGIAT